MDKGAFTRQAMRVGETPVAYEMEVLAHPEKHRLKTRRRAQFMKNITRSRKLSRRK